MSEASYRKERAAVRQAYQHKQDFICPWCGSYVRPGIAYCPRCGQTIYDDPRLSKRETRNYVLVKGFMYFWAFFAAPFVVVLPQMIPWAWITYVVAGVLLFIAVQFLPHEYRVMRYVHFRWYQVGWQFFWRLGVPLIVIGCSLYAIYEALHLPG